MRKPFLTSCMLLAAAISISAQKTEFPKLAGPYLGQTPPGKTPEIFARGIVSTDMVNHCSISMSPDGREIYWAMAPLDTPSRIYFSKEVDGIWSKPEIIHFTLSEDGDCPTLSPNGNKMYFNSSRPLPDNKTRRERIWCVEKIREGWGDPFPLGKEINDEHLHWQVAVDTKGNLYFGSERIGTKGKDDVFFTEYMSGAYKRPISLGDEINSGAHEGCPYVAPDGTYLIFARNGLWISFKGENAMWGKAVSMGKMFEDAICPYVSPDGECLFFLKVGKGYDDVYWVSTKIIDELRSKAPALRILSS